MALGEVDYGLMGVVGGLVGFLGFFNNIMSSSVGRFYAVAIGEESVNPEVGLEKCRKWFTSAVVGNTIWPSIVVAIAHPIGLWAINHYLNIPSERITSCVWVWRFVCASFWVSIVTLPFNAMYTAKQFIAELTIYSFTTTTLNMCFLYYVINHPADWLVRYSLWTCVLSVFPNLIIAIRAHALFKECRIIRKYLFCWDSLRQMLSYSWWTIISGAGAVMANQGCMILVNKSFGPAANAAVNIGSSLATHTTTLGGSMIGAFSPAIMNAYGAGNYSLMQRFVYRVCKIGVLCMLIFVIPLSLEVDTVLTLWLKTPPAYAAGCCLLAMLQGVLDKFSVGYLIAIYATGRIAKFQLYVGAIWFVVLPAAMLFVSFGGGVYSVLFALVLARLYAVVARVWFARRLLCMGLRQWCKEIVNPLLLLTLVVFGVGCVPRFWIGESPLRVICTTIIVEVALLPLAWVFVLNKQEREFIILKLQAAVKRIL